MSMNQLKKGLGNVSRILVFVIYKALTECKSNYTSTTMKGMLKDLDEFKDAIERSIDNHLLMLTEDTNVSLIKFLSAESAKTWPMTLYKKYYEQHNAYLSFMFGRFDECWYKLCILCTKYVNWMNDSKLKNFSWSEENTRDFENSITELGWYIPDFVYKEFSESKFAKRNK